MARWRTRLPWGTAREVRESLILELEGWTRVHILHPQSDTDASNLHIRMELMLGDHNVRSKGS